MKCVECDKPAKSKGLCNTHYERKRLGRNPRPVPRECSIDGCSQMARARGWCFKHWARWKAHGDPNVTIRDYGAKRSEKGNGYIRVWVPGHPTAAADGYALEHRYVMHELGHDVDGMHVHHLDHDRSNNDPANLVVMTAEEHMSHHANTRGE